MNTLIEKMIRVKLINVHNRYGINYHSFSREWQSWLEKLTWDSVHAVATARGVSIDEAIEMVI